MPKTELIVIFIFLFFIFYPKAAQFTSVYPGAQCPSVIMPD